MTRQKPKKDSLVDFTRKYANDEEACYDFFFHARYPEGYICEKCGCSHFRKITRHRVAMCTECRHQQYLFAGTIFQDNKLPLYKLLLGLYLFFTSNKGISAIEMKSQLNVNYKTALLLCRKCRVLMSESNSRHTLDSMFYEADTAYIGSQSKGENCQGLATEQQPFLAILSTGEENRYPHFLKLFPIPVDNGDMMCRFIEKSVKLSKKRVLNTDGKTTFNTLSGKVSLKNVKIDYKKKNHRLHWLNIVIGNVKNHITGIYHGVSKRDLPLFLQEQAYRFNHRFTGAEIMRKVSGYITRSIPCTKKMISYVLDTALPFFSPTCV